jgi:ribonuclease HII/Holliday junction resolvase-like predicted endonuclease
MTPSRPTYDIESSLYSQGYSAAAGVDEAGRGSLAGPVSAGVAVLPREPEGDWVALVNDSKKLSPRQRETAYEAIKREAVAVSVGYSTSQEIDSIGIAPATRLAIKRALESISAAPDYLLLDAFPLPGVNLPQQAITKGDAKCLTIAAASIAAKVERDRLMIELDAQYPRYSFASNKGYGTAAHLKALADHGPCPIHRMTFGRVRDSLAPTPQRSPTIGSHAEAVAAGHLRTLGYTVLDTNYRTRRGEIDIIAEQDGTLVFCEVRARRRAANVSREESITPAKSRKLIAAAEEYLQTSDRRWADWRMDFIAMELDRAGNVRRIRILENANEG